LAAHDELSQIANESSSQDFGLHRFWLRAYGIERSGATA
jgi:hypothetical protein